MTKHPIYPLRSWPGWVLASSAMLFLLLAVVAAGDSVVIGDEAVIDGVQDLPHTPFDALFRLGNHMGATQAGPIACLALVLVAALRRHYQAIAFCFCLLILRLAGAFLKSLFDSPRPTSEHAEIRGHFDNMGFPSGHALTAILIAGAITVVIPAVLGPSRWLTAAIAIAWIGALTCGLARVWLGAHWPTDVVGGFLIGIVMLWLSAFVASRYRPETYQARPITRTNSDPHRSSESR